jgi:hypothetical protein
MDRSVLPLILLDSGDLRMRSYTSPSPGLSALVFSFPSAPLELELGLGWRAGWRGLDHGTRQVEVLEDLCDGLATRNPCYLPAL